jgi:cell division protein FtsI/penicillin-binding protein 2
LGRGALGATSAAARARREQRQGQDCALLGLHMAGSATCHQLLAFVDLPADGPCAQDGLLLFRDLGLQSRTGLDLPGEIRSRAAKDIGNPGLQLANLGFGQAMSVTPIALAGAFGAIGNEGKRVPLRLVKSVNGIERPIREGQQVLSKQSCDYTLECMERVMSSIGTGSSLRIPGYRIGGKTGTAQKFSKGQNRGYVSNFVGMIPARDPQAVILVMIDDPKAGKIYGSDVAGPVFKDVAKVVIARLNIPRE